MRRSTAFLAFLLVLGLSVKAEPPAAASSPVPSPVSSPAASPSPVSNNVQGDTDDPKDEVKPEDESKESRSLLSRLLPPFAVIAVVLGVVVVCLYCWRRKRQQVFVEAVLSDPNQPREFNEPI